MNLVKKISIFALTLATVFTMSGSLLPSAKAAGNYGAGSLLAKANTAGAAVYYIGNDGKKYVFPDMKTYFTWYENFDAVVKVSVTELDLYTNGGAVTVRPGTKLVKTSDTAKVFAIEPGGVARHIPTAEIASALFGANWASRVVDLIPGFFSNYPEGTALSTTLPTGTLAKDGTTYYYTEGTSKRAFSSMDAFEANNFNLTNVLNMSLASYTAGTTITGAETALKGFMAVEGGNQTSGNVTVSLSAATPVVASILADSTANEYPQALIPFTTVNFTASASGSVQVNTVKFTRFGISSDADLGNLYLYDGETRLAEYTSFSDKVVTFSNTSGLFTVPAGTTKAVTLRGDLARGSTSVTSGKTIGFKLDTTSDVTLSSGSVSGTFPATGNLMETAAVSDMGHLYAHAYETGSYPASVRADEADKELWRMTLTADSQDMEVRYMKYTMVGTISATDVQNLELEVAGVKVGATAQIANDNSVIFDLSSSPIAITAGQAVKVENLTITCTGSDTTDYISNVKLLLDGSQIGTTDTTLQCNGSSGDSTNYTFGNTFIVPNGTYKYVTAVADTTASSTAAGSTLRIDLSAGSANAVGQSTLTSLSSTAQQGRTLTVQSGTVVVSENTAFGDKSATSPTGVAGAT